MNRCLFIGSYLCRECRVRFVASSEYILCLSLFWTVGVFPHQSCGSNIQNNYTPHSINMLLGNTVSFLFCKDLISHFKQKPTEILSPLMKWWTCNTVETATDAITTDTLLPLIDSSNCHEDLHWQYYLIFTSTNHCQFPVCYDAHHINFDLYTDFDDEFWVRRNDNHGNGILASGFNINNKL